MDFTQFVKSHTKHIFIGLQVLLICAVFFVWLLNRGNAFTHIFTVDEYTVSDNAVLGDHVTMEAGESGIFLSTPALHLKKGIYQVQIDYIADSAGNTVSASSSLGSMEMHCPAVELVPSTYSAAMTLDLARSADDVRFHVSYSGSGSFSVLKIGVYETSHGYKKNIFHAFLLCLLLNFLYFLKHSHTGRRKIILALTGIFIVSCYPLYTDFLTVGHDLPFHLLRMEAISQGLSNGTFPVKLHPLWANGQGYAVGIFYGDAFLYLPAVLRLLGLSIQSAYKFFVAFINLGTVLISYYSFRKIFSDNAAGLLGCLAYTLAPYRLMDMYTRASVGEYTAMMMLPLILCGFYLIFHSGKENWLRYAILTAFGLTGLIQSHVLSSVMIAFVVILVCILLVRRVFSKYAFRSLALAALLTLLLNLNFIVPFLDFYQEDIMINSPDWAGRTAGSFQEGGLFPAQLFTLFQNSNGGAWSVSAGIHNEATYGIGILLTAGIFLFVYLFCIYRKDCKEDRNYRASLLCMLLGALLLWMCTCYFPWDALASLGTGIGNVIYSLQFPWRFLAPATVLLTFVLCFSFRMAGQILQKHFGLLFTGCMVLLAVNCGWYFYDFSFSGEPYRVYNTNELYTMQLYSYDYLPGGTDPDAIEENAVYTEGVEPLQSYQKQGTRIRCDIQAGTEGGYVDFPLLHYKYYRCVDLDNGQDFPVSAGTNNMVRVTFPASYSGHVQVSFVEPWFWRAAEILSFLTLLACAGALLFRTGGRKQEKQNSKKFRIFC